MIFVFANGYQLRVIRIYSCEKFSLSTICSRHFENIIIHLEYLNVSTKSGDMLELSSLLTCILYLVEKYLMISYAIYYRRKYFSWFYIETGTHHSFDSNFRFPCILFWTWTVLCKKKVRIKIKILPIYDYICCL